MTWGKMKLLKWIGLVVMLIALCACAHSASAAPVVSVEPGSIEVTEGETFTVNITVYPEGSEIMSAQYVLKFGVRNTNYTSIIRW